MKNPSQQRDNPNFSLVAPLFPSSNRDSKNMEPPRESSIVANQQPKTQNRILNSQEEAEVVRVLRKYLKSWQLKENEREIQSQANKQGGPPISTISIASAVVPGRVEPTKNAFDLSVFQLERIEIDVRFNALQRNVGHQASKMNDHIAKLEGLINQNWVKNGHQLMGKVGHFLNSLILTTNLMISKLMINQEDMVQSNEQSELENSSLRWELRSLEVQSQALKQTIKCNKIHERQLEQEMERLRSVMASYQSENFDLRNELHVLTQVIDEMNVQVDKGEKKLSARARELRQLQCQHQRLLLYAQELEMELRDRVDNSDELHRLQERNEKQEDEVRKWKARCFEER